MVKNIRSRGRGRLVALLAARRAHRRRRRPQEAPSARRTTRSRSASACSATSATTTSTSSSRRRIRTSRSRKTSRATRTTTRTSPSTSRPARARTTSRRSRSASSPQFKAQPQNFVDLRQYGAATLKSRWLPWKWQQSVAPGRRRDRPRHRRRQPRDLLPHGPVRRRPASRRTAPRSRSSGRRGRPTSTPASASRRKAPKGTLLLRLGLERLQRDDRPAQPGLLRRQGQGHRRRRTRASRPRTT